MPRTASNSSSLSNAHTELDQLHNLYGTGVNLAPGVQQPWKQKRDEVAKAFGRHDYWHLDFLRALLFAGYVDPKDNTNTDDLLDEETVQSICLYFPELKQPGAPTAEH